MIPWWDVKRGRASAIEQSHAVAEFARDGRLLRANQPFLDAMGYAKAELRGKHHSVFQPPE